MKGLLLKDFYNLRTTLKTMLMILVIFLAFVIIRHYEFALPLIPVLLSSSLLTTVINLDKHSKWNMLMVTAPIEKKELVQEKYALLMLLNICGILIGTAASIPFILSGKIKLVSFIDMTLLGWSISLLQGTIFLTLSYLFGKNLMEKLELMMVVSYVVSFAIIIPVYFLVPDLFGTENHSLIITHFIIFLAILAVYGILEKVSITKSMKSENL